MDPVRDHLVYMNYFNYRNSQVVTDIISSLNTETVAVSYL